MTRKRIPWKQYFMMQALVIAQRSTCVPNLRKTTKRAG